jgi:hypothetical protein
MTRLRGSQAGRIGCVSRHADGCEAGHLRKRLDAWLDGPPGGFLAPPSGTSLLSRTSLFFPRARASLWTRAAKPSRRALFSPWEPGAQSRKEIMARKRIHIVVLGVIAASILTLVACQAAQQTSEGAKAAKASDVSKRRAASDDKLPRARDGADGTAESPDGKPGEDGGWGQGGGNGGNGWNGGSGGSGGAGGNGFRRGGDGGRGGEAD